MASLFLPSPYITSLLLSSTLYSPYESSLFPSFHHTLFLFLRLLFSCLMPILLWIFSLFLFCFQELLVSVKKKWILLLQMLPYFCPRLSFHLGHFFKQNPFSVSKSTFPFLFGSNSHTVLKRAVPVLRFYSIPESFIPVLLYFFIPHFYIEMIGSSGIYLVQGRK